MTDTNDPMLVAARQAWSDKMDEARKAYSDAVEPLREAYEAAVEKADIDFRTAADAANEELNEATKPMMIGIAEVVAEPEPAEPVVDHTLP
jgi:hypothetical protein